MAPTDRLISLHSATLAAGAARVAEWSLPSWAAAPNAVTVHAGFAAAVAPPFTVDLSDSGPLGHGGVVEVAELRVKLSTVSAAAEHRPYFRSRPTSTGSWSEARKGVGLPATLFRSGLVQAVLAQAGLTLNSVL